MALGNAIKIIASEESIKDDLFLHVQLLVMNNKVNLNGVVATKDFIKRIAENQEKYIHTPLFCDVGALKTQGNLTHRFDSRTGKFDTSQIGSFTSFKAVEIDDVMCLIGEAKIPKRDEETVDALMALSNKDGLKFSYEVKTFDSITVGDVEYITGDERNQLIGVTVVTDPAIREARALKVAEEQKEKEDSEALEKENKNIISKENDKEKEKNTEETETTTEPVKEEPVEPETDDEKEKEENKNAESCSNDEDKKEQLIKLKNQNAELKRKLETAEADISNLKNQNIELQGKYDALLDEKTQKEHDIKKSELENKVKDILSKEEIDSLAEAFEALDENEINKVLVEKLLTEKTAKKNEEKNSVETASYRTTDSVAIKKNRWITE